MRYLDRFSGYGPMQVGKELYCHISEVFWEACCGPQLTYMIEETATCVTEWCPFFSWKESELQVHLYF